MGQNPDDTLSHESPDTRSLLAALPIKRRRFVHYLLGEAKGNATQAYRLAGYAVKTSKVAEVEGHRLLGIPVVQATIRALEAEREKVSEVTAEWIVKDLMRLRDLAEGLGQMAAAVKCVELAGRTKGIFIDKQQVQDITPERRAILERIGARLTREEGSELLRVVGQEVH